MDICLSMLRCADAVFMLRVGKNLQAPERRMPWPRSWKWKLSSRKRSVQHEQSLTSRFEEKPRDCQSPGPHRDSFVPLPVATEEEFQTLAAELSRRLEQMAVEAEKKEGGAA
jgi:hypothetical protein